jgi:4'-phosphopantetheinyl transferase
MNNYKNFCKIKRINGFMSLSIVNIDDFADNFLYGVDSQKFRFEKNRVFEYSQLKSIFNETEVEIINSFKTLKRQVEWMSGKLCVKTLVNEKTDKDPTEISVSIHEKGAPYLKDFPGFYISISHSNTYAVAVLSRDKNVGIDVEKVEKNSVEYVLKAGFSKREKEALDLKDEYLLYKNWTKKEAFLKYIKLGFHECLNNVEVINGIVFYNNSSVNDCKMIEYNLSDDYPLSICVEN